MLTTLFLSVALGALGAGSARPPVISPEKVHTVKLIHVAEQEVRRGNDSLDFRFDATVESYVNDRSELISIFLGPKAGWKDSGWTDCDCKYTWYKVEFLLKNDDPIVVEIDPCGQGFQEAIRIIGRRAFSLRLSPAQSRSLGRYFAPLVAEQAVIRKLTKDAAEKRAAPLNPCVDGDPSDP